MNMEMKIWGRKERKIGKARFFCQNNRIEIGRGDLSVDDHVPNFILECEGSKMKCCIELRNILTLKRI